ncbi:MAG TPA: hypothetical protein VHT73_13540 [Thermodesulfobacteriota bacterium]|nr:hypothetical protein [Thermodesulfobacteriota bacterium]
MRNFEKRISELEQCISHIRQEKPLEPIGIASGCNPEALITWFDYCLSASSKWHELDFEEKYQITVDVC